MQRGRSLLPAAPLDQATDSIVELFGNPLRGGFLRPHGSLVVGDVQSGKTASYAALICAALICKAADAGYRMVILLTGTLENVRRQTQERLDAAFVGFDSRDFLTTGKSGARRALVSDSSTAVGTGSSSPRATTISARSPHPRSTFPLGLSRNRSSSSPKKINPCCNA